MAHWAQIDENNIVVNVTVGNNDEPDEGYQWLLDNLGGNWVKTSYNSRHGKRIDPETGQESADHFRYNYAGIGFTFDASMGSDGAFIPPQPFPSWVLNQETADWDAPVPQPEGDNWFWDEDTQQWTLEDPNAA